jgi:hypothetical protein
MDLRVLNISIAGGHYHKLQSLFENGAAVCCSSWRIHLSGDDRKGRCMRLADVLVEALKELGGC